MYKQRFRAKRSQSNARKPAPVVKNERKSINTSSKVMQPSENKDSDDEPAVPLKPDFTTIFSQLP